MHHMYQPPPAPKLRVILIHEYATYKCAQGNTGGDIHNYNRTNKQINNMIGIQANNEGGRYNE